jgi:hypothetical protein
MRIKAWLLCSALLALGSSTAHAAATGCVFAGGSHTGKVSMGQVTIGGQKFNFTPCTK